MFFQPVSAVPGKLEPVFEFSTLEELLNHEYVASTKEREGFHRFSISVQRMRDKQMPYYLMLERHGGKDYWILGTLSADTKNLGLPHWYYPGR